MAGAAATVKSILNNSLLASFSQYTSQYEPFIKIARLGFFKLFIDLNVASGVSLGDN